MISEQKMREIMECKRILEDPSLRYYQRASLEVYLKSLEKNGN
jgi:hypothetical protein